jgi:hypothetical protein
MERREFYGGVLSTTLSNNVSDTDTFFSVGSAITFPTGYDNPYAIVVSRGEDEEEKMLVSSRSADTLFIKVRGYDGTTPQNHLSGAVVDHVLDSTTIQAMNKDTYDTVLMQWMGI